MPISRRKMFTRGAAAAAGSLAFVPQEVTGQAPAQLTGTNAGRRFKAFVRHGTGASVEELRLHAIQPREVLVRTQASAVCYTIVGGALSTANAAQASIPNHSGMGVVEEVGPLVKRVQKGDRVVVPGTPQCGVCYQCLHGRADWCQFLDTAPAHPLAEMSDGTQIFEQAGLGGLSELMVVPEEYCCPVFTDLPAEQLTLLGDTVGTGLAGGARPRADRTRLERGGAGRRAGGYGSDPGRAARQRRSGDCDRADPNPAGDCHEGRRHNRSRSERGRQRTRRQNSLAVQGHHRPSLRRRPQVSARAFSQCRMAPTSPSTPWAAIGFRRRLRSGPTRQPFFRCNSASTSPAQAAIS